MALATKKCKVCGREYEYCHTLKNLAGVFRWQDVACSPEHGSIYLSQIRESRGQASEPITPVDSHDEEIYTVSDENIEADEDISEADILDYGDVLAEDED